MQTTLQFNLKLIAVYILSIFDDVCGGGQDDDHDSDDHHRLRPSHMTSHTLANANDDFSAVLVFGEDSFSDCAGVRMIRLRTHYVYLAIIYIF